MENHMTSFIFEIDSFLVKEAPVSSQTFVSGGCKWFLQVNPKGHQFEDHLSLYLYVANPYSLRPGWIRRANYSFIVLDQSGKEHLRKTSNGSKLFSAQFGGWGYSKMLPLIKLKEEGFMENNKLIIKVEVNVVEVVHEGEFIGKEMFDFQGFQIPYSQATSVDRLFKKHPDIAVDFRPKNEGVKTAYMNLLLDLIETLSKPPHSFSEAELSNANSELCELSEAGFKIDWLKKKLHKVSLKRTRVVDDGARIQELEEHIKNLNVELENERAKASKVLSLEQTVSDLKAELENEKAKASKVLSLEQTVSDLKAELRNEKAKAYKVLSLEKIVSDLKAELKIENAKGSKVLSLEQTVSHLKAKLEKEKSVESSTSKVVSLKNAVCFWETKSLGIRQRMAGYQKLK